MGGKTVSGKSKETLRMVVCLKIPLFLVSEHFSEQAISRSMVSRV